MRHPVPSYFPLPSSQTQVGSLQMTRSLSQVADFVYVDVYDRWLDQTPTATPYAPNGNPQTRLTAHSAAAKLAMHHSLVVDHRR
jgi:hypothetical protein